MARTANLRGTLRSSLPPALARRLHDLDEKIRASPYAHHILRGIRMGKLVVTGFKTERITLRAASLTYLSLLSIVPTLAVVYAMFKGFGGMADIQDRVNAWIFQNIAVGSQEVVQQAVEKFVTQAHTGAVGGIGFVVLLMSAVSLLWNIEASFNAIWSVRQQRKLVMRFLIYWCVLTLGPILLAVSLTATATFSSAPMVTQIPGGKALLGLAPLGLTYTAFTLLYFIVPNARVKKRSAIIGAFVAGSVWELAKLGYAVYATRAFKANAFYGSLAAIPVFMIWIYFSWTIVLAGARLVYAIDASVEAETVTPVLSPLERRHWLARVACVIGEAFRAGRPPPRPDEIAHALGAPPALLEDVAQSLQDAGLVREAEDGGLLPARPLEQITLYDIHLAALAQGGGEAIQPAQEPGRDLFAVLGDAEAAAQAKLAAHTLASLVGKDAKGS